MFTHVLHFKLITQSPTIYYGMPKNMLRNKLFIKCNYTFKGNLMPSKLTPTCSYRCFALQASNNPQQFTMVCLRTWWETNCLLSAIVPSKAIWCHLNWLLHVHACFKLVTKSPIIYYGMPKNMVRHKLPIMCNYT